MDPRRRGSLGIFSSVKDKSLGDCSVAAIVTLYATQLLFFHHYCCYHSPVFNDARTCVAKRVKLEKRSVDLIRRSLLTGTACGAYDMHSATGLLVKMFE